MRSNRVFLALSSLLFILLGVVSETSARATNNFLEESRENALFKAKSRPSFQVGARGGVDGDGIGMIRSGGSGPMKRRATPTAGITNKPWLELEGIPPSRVSVRLHSDITLECQAVGSPPPAIHWRKNGQPMDSGIIFTSEEVNNQVDRDDSGAPIATEKSGFVMAKAKSKLPLRCIRPEDEGQYACVADNNGRQLVSTTLVVIEEDDPSDEVRPECEFKLALVNYEKKVKQGVPAYILSSESLHMESIGSDVLLPCRGAGRPRPSITWIDAEGQRVVPGKKFQVNGAGNLIIRSLSWSDMGEYSCVAENEFGSDLASTFLYPLQTEDS